MPADAAIVEDKPGKCPVCAMTLVPTRIDAKWWCPTHQTLVVRDQAGTCPLDHRALVPVTLSEQWTCPQESAQTFLDPGICSNGQPRSIGYTVRAHGDHNPKHDGQFFMASDQWHHLEGTYPRAGVFRVFFYDNFTKPLRVQGVSGSLLALDRNDQVIATLPLTPGRDGVSLEAQVPPAMAGLPFKAAAKIRFEARTPEQRFDFNFATYSHDVATSGSGPTSRITGPVSTKASLPRATAVVAAAAPSRSEPTTRPSAPPPPAKKAAPLILDSPLAIPAALADALDESRLPVDRRGLMAALAARASEIQTLVQSGNLAEVWVPAMGAKTVALAFGQRAAGLPSASRARVQAVVKRIVIAAWELDSAGDLGNRQLLSGAYDRLASAVRDLDAIHES
jgi:hypothetical protein